MNIFAEKGIRDVADVTLYSINRIGTEEFYLPVLYLDSLRLTNFSKNVGTSEHYGGIGNRKTVSWSYTKDIKLKAEDALFTQASLSMLATGQLAQKMSPWTSAIAKLSVANKYGRNSYSTKAYPSPELTDEEWEIVFRCAQKAGFDPRTGDMTPEIEYPDPGPGGGEVIRSAIKEQGRLPLYGLINAKYLYSEDDANNQKVAENRWILQQNYLHRTQKTPISCDLAPYIEKNKNCEGVSIIMGETSYYDILRFIEQSSVGDEIEEVFDGIFRFYWSENIVIFPCNLVTRIVRTHKGFSAKNAFVVVGIPTYSGGGGAVERSVESFLSPTHLLSTMFPGGIEANEETFLIPIGDKKFLDNILWFIFSPNYADRVFFSEQLNKRWDSSNPFCWVQQQERKCLAMPQEIIDLISDEINNIKDFGYQQNSLKEIKQIDRYTKCTVTDPHGLKIDLVEQFANIKKMYKDEKDNYIVYYDAKTMMPFAESTFLTEDITKQKSMFVYFETSEEHDAAKKNKFLSYIQDYFARLYGEEAEGWIGSLTPNDIIITSIDEQVASVTEIKFLVTKRDYITLKYGTCYYKKERVVDTDDNDISFLGINIPINYDTFKGEYLIVGDTMVKDQATGKDQPCQIIINRATISSSTTLNLSGKGEPATFSFDVGILDPIDENKDAVELIFYNTEKDERNGGERVIPQSKRYARTPILKTKEEVVAANEEMY